MDAISHIEETNTEAINMDIFNFEANLGEKFASIHKKAFDFVQAKLNFNTYKMVQHMQAFRTASSAVKRKRKEKNRKAVLAQMQLIMRTDMQVREQSKGIFGIYIRALKKYCTLDNKEALMKSVQDYIMQL